MNNIVIGFYIFGVGMAVLFAALGLLALVIGWMGRLFSVKPKIELRGSSVEHESTGVDVHLNGAVAAAVAVSYLAAERKRHTGLGETLLRPSGPYRSSRELSQKPIVIKMAERIE